MLFPVFRLNYFRLVRLPMLLFILAACPGTATPGRVCESNTSSCIDGRPHVCLSTGQWRDTDPLDPCPATTACCLIAGVDGRPIHSCALPDQCLPEGTGQPTYAPPADPAPRTTKAARDWTSGGPGSPTGDAR